MTSVFVLSLPKRYGVETELKRPDTECLATERIVRILEEKPS